MEKYGVLRECELAHAKAKDDSTKQRELELIAEAIWALSSCRLARRETS